ncbi:MAG TPA: SNF2-related protein [bacterium]|nr:SNF2-related protein [bacterium]
MPELREHQRKIVETAPNKYGLFLKMRVGKTATAIRLASTRVKSCIVIVPKSLKEQWESEIKNWNNSDTIFFVITKETFRRDYTKLDKYDAIVVDESHIGFANFKSQLFKSLSAYIKHHDIQYIWLLTGTPFTSSAWSTYSLALLLGHKYNWYEWKKRFFYDIKMGHRMIPKQKDNIESEIAKIVNNIGCTLSLSDISEQADDEYVKEYFDLNAEQKKAIKEYFDPLPIVRFTWHHQLESGTIKGDGYRSDGIYQCEKNNRLIEIVKEIRKVAIVARYNLQLQHYADIFKQEGRRVFLINGQTKNLKEIIDQIEKEEDCVVLLNATCSAGYSLASIDIMIFASMDFSFTHYAQICDRLKNMDKNKSCTYIYLLTRSTKDYKSIDQGVYDCVMNKQSFDAEIYAKQTKR